jgi:hypothetical protein
MIAILIIAMAMAMEVASAWWHRAPDDEDSAMRAPSRRGCIARGAT